MPGFGERLEQQRERRPWLDHLMRSYGLYKEKNGDHMAAAVTYFSFLALFPLILVGFAILGLVLQKNPHLITDVQNQVRRNAPGGVGGILGTAMRKAADSWAAAGIIGLAGALYAGLGWIGNLRTAIQEIWAYDTAKEKFLAAKLRDLVALFGLGLAVIVSLVLTAAGTAATHSLVTLAHVDDVPGAGVVTRILGIVIAVLADTVIFGWMLVRLPRSPLTMRAVFRGSLFAAIGYEILKVVGTYYIAQVGKSPSAGVFGSVLGLIVFINLVSRFLLFSTAWTATLPAVQALHERHRPVTEIAVVEEDPGAVRVERADRSSVPSGGAIAAGLVGIGAVSGAALSEVTRRTLARRRS